MGVLSSFERRLSSLVEGTFAKVFRGGVEPVEIAGALTRECDAQKVIGARSTMVPNAFVVDLGDADSGRLTPYAEPLAAELAAMVREHAAEQRYTFAGPVTVRLAHDVGLDTGVFRVHAEVSTDGAVAGWEPVAHQPGVSAADPRVSPTPLPTAGSALAPAREELADARLVVVAHGSAPVDSPEARGLERAFTLTAAVTRIGRAHDVDLRLDDTAVSRHHTEIRRLPDGRSHLLVDLGSTNGTSVNGRRVQTAELHDSDRIEIGAATLVYRTGPPADGRA